MPDTIDDVSIVYAEWKRLHCGPRRMVSLLRKSRWQKAMSLPWLWWSHYTTARLRTTRYRSTVMATLFTQAFLELPRLRERWRPT